MRFCRDRTQKARPLGEPFADHGDFLGGIATDCIPPHVVNNATNVSQKIYQIGSVDSLRAFAFIEILQVITK